MAPIANPIGPKPLAPKPLAPKSKNLPAQPVGSGVNGAGKVQPGPVPRGAGSANVANFLTGSAPAKDALVASFGFFLPPGFDAGALKAEITSLSGKVQDVTSETTQNKIQMSADEQCSKLEKKNECIQDSIKKMNEQHDCSIWDKIKLAFEYIGAALSIAAGAIASVFGGAGAPLIAAGIILLVLAVNDTIAMATEHGILGHIVAACGVTDPKVLADCDMAFAIVLAVAAIACSIYSAASGVPAIVSAATSVMSAVELAQTLAAALVTVIAGGLKLDNGLIEAAAKRLKATACELDADVQASLSRSHMEIKNLAAAHKRAAAEVSSTMQMFRDETDAVLKAGFTA